MWLSAEVRWLPVQCSLFHEDGGLTEWLRELPVAWSSNFCPLMVRGETEQKNNLLAQLKFRLNISPFTLMSSVKLKLIYWCRGFFSDAGGHVPAPAAPNTLLAHLKVWGDFTATGT
jgi:hypothetical protein